MSYTVTAYNNAGDVVGVFKLHEPFTPTTEGIMTVAINGAEFVDITGQAYIPKPGATWTGESFIQGEVAHPVVVPNPDPSVPRFAAVVSDRCAFTQEFPDDILPELVEAYRTGVRFELNEVLDTKPAREVRPWDFLNPKTEYATDEVAKARLDICKSCPELIKLTHQCKKCGCFMHLKTKLSEATCPIGKW